MLRTRQPKESYSAISAHLSPITVGRGRRTRRDNRGAQHSNLIALALLRGASGGRALPKKSCTPRTDNRTATFRQSSRRRRDGKRYYAFRRNAREFPVLKTLDQCAIQ